MGKVTFEVIKMMVQEQIRTAVKDFQSWNRLQYSFLDNDIPPYDRIHVPVHEFIVPDTLQSVANFLSAGPKG